MTPVPYNPKSKLPWNRENLLMLLYMFIEPVANPQKDQISATSLKNKRTPHHISPQGTVQRKCRLLDGRRPKLTWSTKWGDVGDIWLHRLAM